MLVDNPLLTLLGRRGRAQVIEALRRAPNRTWGVRDLATFALVEPMTASRTVKELLALGAVAWTRPGRDARIRWRPDSAAAQWLQRVDAPDLRGSAAATFAHAYAADGHALLLWRHPDDDPADPLAPPRVAILVARATDEVPALEAAGPALDAVRAAGLPAPDVATFVRSRLDPDDRVAQAVLGGTPLQA